MKIWGWIRGLWRPKSRRDPVSKQFDVLVPGIYKIVDEHAEDPFAGLNNIRALLWTVKERFSDADYERLCGRVWVASYERWRARQPRPLPPIDWRAVNRGRVGAALPIYILRMGMDLVSGRKRPHFNVSWPASTEWQSEFQLYSEDEKRISAHLQRYSRASIERRRGGVIETIHGDSGWPTGIAPIGALADEADVALDQTVRPPSVLIVPSRRQVIEQLESARDKRQQEWDAYRALFYLDPETSERKL